MKKVYLETPEAVIKALKEGKEVRDENNYSFKIVDGFIVSTDENEFFVGDIFSGNRPYILEEEPFKIKVGNWYETRDHQKVRCFKINPGLCFFTLDNVGNFNTLINGNYYINGKISNLDIIGPWEE